MKQLTYVDALGARYYRYHVDSVQGYLNAELGAIASVPLIHSPYAPSDIN